MEPLVYTNDTRYLQDVAIVKRYGDRVKITLCKNLRVKGFEDDIKSGFSGVRDKPDDNYEKSESSIVRSKGRIEEIVLCNDWDYFVTITLDPKKYDRNDLGKWRKDFTQFIRNQRRKGYDIRYLFIPEEHSKGGWHMHGFIAGIPDCELRKFSLSEKLPHYLRDKIKMGLDIYDWSAYRNRFGFVDAEPIRSKDRAANYVKKYITKDLERTVKEQGANLYYCSQGLNRAEVLCVGRLDDSLDTSSWWSNDYVKVKWYDASVVQKMLDNIVLPNIFIPDPKAQCKREWIKELKGETIEGFKREFDICTGEIYSTPFDDMV